jgi:16S rRNA (cytidine1402-2'-O)-methyltransferase
LVSDAGTPNICDPGAYLIKEVIQNNYRVIPVPGPSAIATLVSISGILANSFSFSGFFPKSKTEAFKLLETLEPSNYPVVFYETAKRLLSTLDFLEKEIDVTTICLAKEMTKKFETYLYGTVPEIKKQLTTIQIKGEWCIIFTYKLKIQKSVSSLVQSLFNEGLTTHQILFVAHKILKHPKNEVYKHVLLNKQPD